MPNNDNLKMVNNNNWVIEQLREYFATMPIEVKGFSEIVKVENKYNNAVIRSPKIMVSEIMNVPKRLTFDGERISAIGTQLNIYAGLMMIGDDAVLGYDAVEHIAILVNELMANRFGMRRVGNAEPMPSPENPEEEYIKPLRYEYTQDLLTDIIF